MAVAVGGLHVNNAQAQHSVPNSAGTEAPKLTAPANACDCHMHIYDTDRFPVARPGSRLQSNARVTEYRLLQRRLGTRRTVIVTPAPYATTNDVTLDAMPLNANVHDVSAAANPRMKPGANVSRNPLSPAVRMASAATRMKASTLWLKIASASSIPPPPPPPADRTRLVRTGLTTFAGIALLEPAR